MPTHTATEEGQIPSRSATLLRTFGQIHVRAQRRELTCHGASPTRCLILTQLDRDQAMTLGELSSRIGFDKSWTSRAVDRLLADGLLKKSAGVADRRTVALVITAKGKRYREQIDALLNAQASRVIERTPPEHRSAVLDALELIVDAYQQDASDEASVPGTASLVEAGQ